MKKIIFLLMAMVAMSVQAQTCKVSATENNGRVVQISVNLDSLKGRTLVTTINHIQNNVVLNMSYEGTNVGDSVAVMAREESSEPADTLESDVVENPDTEVQPEDDAAEAPHTLGAESEPSSGTSILDILGLSSVTSFVTEFTKENGVQYEEYEAALKSITEVDSTKYIPQYKQRKWSWMDKYNSYSTLEVSGIFGKDFGDGNLGDEDAISEEKYGMDPETGYNLGGSAKFSQVFIPGRYTADGKFIPNSLSFGWSIGGLFAFDYEKDYGWSADVMAKVGIQAGNGITMGVDALIGGGATPYAIYSTDGLNYRVITHTQWCLKYGIQAWLSMNYGSNTYTSLFARLVKSKAPQSVYEHPTAPMWETTLIDFDEGSWRVGFAVGYKFGYNADLKDKRLQATIGIGYNLLGGEKDVETMVELEKINQISPTLDFSYGLGYGYSYGQEHLQNFVLTGGWLFKLNPNHKFYYLAKLYAGAGEYMVGKKLQSEDNVFNMTNNRIRQLCLKGGVNLGVAYRFGCSTLSASLRCGYHHGFDPETEGFKTIENSNLRGVDLTPTLNYTINF
ncbi:MAG: hypothetical protein J6Y91_00470 [Alphaproteobacteria bacterium]|nr:hypothetical protein [Alphaproteobacteria bacterium]